MNITRSTLSAVAIACIAPSWGVLHGQVDPSGSWRTWRTDHFRVHARTELRESALRAAEEAEWAYQLLARELEPPRGVIELVLSDDVDFSNGFASTFPTNRVTVYLAPPGDPSVSLARYDDWLRLVITHELTHIFHLDRADGLWGMLQTVFGRAPGLFPNVYQPSWVHEGLATYYESRLTNAGRVRGAFHEQLLTAAATDDRWPAPGDAVFANPMWPGGFRPYAWGSRFFEMSEATGRDSVISRFVDRTSRQLLPVNVSSAWRPLTGESVDDTWRRMRAAAAGAGLRDPDTVLVRGLRSEPMIRLSRDGSRLAYRWRDDRNTQRVVMIRVSDGTRIGVRRANEIHGLAWAADSLYVAQLDFSSPVQIRSDLYRWQPPNSWTRLTRGERVTDAFVTPDRRVGVLVLRRGVRVPMLVGPGSLMPYPAPAGNDWGRVAISPDGRWVAGARHANERWDIVLWPVGEPEDVRLITDDEALDGDPSWTSDGRLVFSSERTGLPQAYLYTLGADDVQQITDVRGGARDPVVAPDGTLFYGTLMADGHAIAATSRVQPVRRAVPSADSRSRPSPLRSPVPSPRERSFAPWPSLLPRYWIPFVHDERDAGLFVRALTTGVDPIGRTAYGMFVGVAPSTGRVELAASVVHSRWRSWSVDATGGQTWDFAGLASAASGNAVPVSFRERSAEVGVRYRWRRWRSGASIRFGAFVEQDALVNDGSEPLGFSPANRTYAGSVVSVGASRFERPALAISPENGGSVVALALRREQVAGPGWSHEFRVGVNGYLALPLPGFAHWVLAARATAGVTAGPTPTVYSVGGVSGDVVDLLPGYTLGSGRRKFPLRGYERGSERFTRAFVGVLELRVPVAAVGRGVPKLPLLLDRVSLAAFGEIGGGWNAGEAVALSSYRDVGGEIVIDTGVGNVVSLRLRAGAAVALTDGLGQSRGDGRLYLTAGSAF